MHHYYKHTIHILYGIFNAVYAEFKNAYSPSVCDSMKMYIFSALLLVLLARPFSQLFTDNLFVLFMPRCAALQCESNFIELISFLTNFDLQFEDIRFCLKLSLHLK